MVKVRLEGFRELEQALRELPRATGKNVLKRVAKGALDPMATAAANGAPHRSGRLAFSIVVSDKRTRRAKQASRFNTSTGIQMAMGPAGGMGALNYAAFDEFGTVDTPAFGFMRRAWDSGAEAALEYVKDNLGAEIDKAIGRQARRAARAAGG